MHRQSDGGCLQVRDEIEAVLGREASVSEVLRAMCDKRLIPTPWLNQVRLGSRPRPRYQAQAHTSDSTAQGSL